MTSDDEVVGLTCLLAIWLTFPLQQLATGVLGPSVHWMWSANFSGLVTGALAFGLSAWPLKPSSPLRAAIWTAMAYAVFVLAVDVSLRLTGEFHDGTMPPAPIAVHLLAFWVGMLLAAKSYEMISYGPVATDEKV